MKSEDISEKQESFNYRLDERIASAIEDAIQSGDFERLRETATLDVLKFAQMRWERESEASVPDFDHLFKLGRISNQLHLSEAESCLKQWLRQGDSGNQNVWDVVGCFLMGYWSSADQIDIDAELVDMLVWALENIALNRDPRDLLILCLSQAHHLLKDKEYSKKIQSCFLALWQKREGKNFQASVLKALENVLEVED